MAEQNDSPFKTFTAGGAIAQHLRVKLSAGVLAVAGSTDLALGTMNRASLASGELSAVRLANAQGTRKMVASEAITAGNPVYAAASGKVAASGTVIEGKALEAAGANNDVIEVLPLPNSDISTSISGTQAAAFEVDTDASTPKIALAGQTAGTGDFTTTLKPESTLSGDNTIIVPEADTDTLVAVALAQTLTNKTLTSPVLNTPKLGDGDAHLTLTSANQTHASATVTFPDIGDAADTAVVADTAQTLTNKTLTSPVINALPKFQNTVTPVPAAGSTVSDAGQLASTMVNHITSDDATKGVKFPTSAQNHLMIVINDSSTAAELYAASGGTVNGLSADASVVIPASKGVLGFSTGVNTWIVFDLPAKASAS